jgi:hypothetical protein
MGDAHVMERIAAWEEAGLIDAGMAARLRAAEADTPEDAGRRNPMAAAAALFGPPVTIAEMFGYLGTGFVLAAWYALVSRIAGTAGGGDVIWVLGHGLVAIAFTLLAAVLLRGSARTRRAAGAAFLVAAGATTAGLNAAGDALTNLEPQVLLVVGAAGGLAAAAVFRKVHPALLTQLGLLAGITTLAWTIQQWVERALYPLDQFGEGTGPGPDPIVRVVLMAGWWLLVAVAVGLIGRREAASGTIDADRRAAMSRAWAGFLAVVGVTGAVLISRYDPSTFESQRVLEPVVGDLLILVVGAILLERAFRREASAFVFPAALGAIIALSDLNASYLAKATSTEVALLVEGVILLVAGFGFERLRRRVAGGPDDSTPTSPESEPATAPGSG